MPDNLENGFIYPDWPAPSNVSAVMTTRSGGISQAPFDSMNLGDHVDDDLEHVQQNRQILTEKLKLPSTPIWLSQVHGAVALAHREANDGAEADAIVAHEVSEVCAIMTADCLPVLFCNKQGTVVAGAHAGWRGLASGVLEPTLREMQCNSEDILVWLGAAIGSTAFEVGGEVKEIFVNQNAAYDIAFKAKGSGKWLTDIYSLARIKLQLSGVSLENIYGGGWCTYSQSELFYSYRRESRTGRMASLIWLD